MKAPIPVFFYSSADSIDLQGQELLNYGAIAVTPAYSELVTALRGEARRRFDSNVRHALTQASTVVAFDEQQGDFDYVARLQDDRRIIVETPHWLRTPTRRAIDSRYTRLSRAIDQGHVAGALVVTQKDVLIPDQYRRAPQGVELVNLHELLERFESYHGWHPQLA